MPVLDLNYGNDMSLSILVENVRKMNDFFFRFWPKKRLENYPKKTKLLILRVIEGGEVMLGNNKIDQWVASLTYFVFLVKVKMLDTVKMLKVQKFSFFDESIDKSLDELDRQIYKLNLQIKMLGATKITMVKHDFETWIKMKERLKWQEPTPQMADHQISSFSVRCLGPDKNAGHAQVGLEDVVRKDLREIGASREGLKKEGFKQIGMEEECTQLVWPQVAWCSS